MGFDLGSVAAVKGLSSIRRVLVAGNHTCGNRGDAAILRGLLHQLKIDLPDAVIDVSSRFPDSSEYLLGRQVSRDVMADWPSKSTIRLRGWARHRYINKLMPMMMAMSIGKPKARALLPKEVQRRVGELKKYDLVIQAGGSFFVDLYGYRQFETPFAAVLADVPLLLLGHSMGPYGRRGYRRLARALIENSVEVSLREPVSLDMLKEAGLPQKTVAAGSDTAWLVPASRPKQSRVPALTGGRGAIAVTLRNLAPFDVRLGIAQREYEAGYAAFADAMIKKGFAVIALSTCTGIDGYQRDDRMPALRVRKLLKHPEHMHVIMDELNDVEIGELLSECELLVGTRLHSAIISMNFGTPAIALNYEHKSAGVLQQLGLSHLASPVRGIIDGSVIAKAEGVLGWSSEQKTMMLSAVARERRVSADMIKAALAKVSEALGK
jgi:colanic acid/amylovoran biosynthesis protein